MGKMRPPDAPRGTHVPFDDYVNDHKVTHARPLSDVWLESNVDHGQLVKAMNSTASSTIVYRWLVEEWCYPHTYDTFLASLNRWKKGQWNAERL